MCVNFLISLSIFFKFSFAPAMKYVELFYVLFLYLF